ncbi:hypothetical protein JOF53_008534 [Crossiella equi]|uniref:Uncharacterized protein n=1 Tax=Crossiella equi TaxID=130796 RepID=A0ABS5ASV9_9PSEU|nr:hypothetical protein [Crossiella equi]MBP2479662.1 hypothetical protein [Crossiella equi]
MRRDQFGRADSAGLSRENTARSSTPCGVLLDRYEQHAPRLATGNEYAPGWGLIATAVLVARTPGPPLPELCAAETGAARDRENLCWRH